ncbi:MAP/microtubule affinity-regulating kinase 3-like isoform X5 [Haemaphysalis longicornis]
MKIKDGDLTARPASRTSDVGGGGDKAHRGTVKLRPLTVAMSSVRTPLQTVHESVTTDQGPIFKCPKPPPPISRSATPGRSGEEVSSSVLSPRTSSASATGAGGGGAPVGRSSRTSEEPHIGRYRLLKTIGKGNFAKVKLAKHVPTGKEVAIKIIDKTQLNPSSLQKLFREVRIMKMLDHPNIVKLYQVIETEKTLYLVMEYASGGEVFDYLVAHGRMKEKEARAKFRQIVSAVQYCHQKRIIHRDLKAENLLLDGEMNIKIADFGFSNEFVPGLKLDTFCGSPPYAAPELFQGKKYDGPEVDVWSLGVILYTLVSGSLPFDGANLKELRERVLRGKYRIPFYMSTDCENLLKKFLVLNPAKRATLEVIMKDKWMNIGYEDDELKPYLEPETDFGDSKRIALSSRAEILMSMGYSRDEIEDSLRNRKYDDIMANYLLLGKRTTENESCDSRSSSSLSLRTLRPGVEAASVVPSAPNQSPSHVKVQRSASATANKPHRRLSHGATTDQGAATPVSNAGTPAAGGGGYKRQNTVDVPSSRGEAPGSPRAAPKAALKKAGSGGTSLANATSSPSKAAVAVRKAAPNSAAPNYIKANLSSGIPRRNTYNYAEAKAGGGPATIDAPASNSSLLDDVGGGATPMRARGHTKSASVSCTGRSSDLVPLCPSDPLRPPSAGVGGGVGGAKSGGGSAQGGGGGGSLAASPLPSHTNRPFPRGTVNRSTFHSGQTRRAYNGPGSGGGPGSGLPQQSQDTSSVSGRQSFFSKLSSKFSKSAASYNATPPPLPRELRTSTPLALSVFCRTGHRNASSDIRRDDERGAGEAALAALHVEHEDDLVAGPRGDHAGDPQGAGPQQLRLRAAREVPAAVRARGPQHGLTGPVGDRGVQAAAPVAQRGALQAHLRHLHRLQEHRLQGGQRAQALTPPPHTLVRHG